MTWDRYDYESSGDNETTQDQIYLRHIRMELQQVTAALHELVAVIKIQTVVQAAGNDEARWMHVPESWLHYETADWIQPTYAQVAAAEEEEPPDQEIDVPDYGPPGSGAVITEWP